MTHGCPMVRVAHHRRSLRGLGRIRSVGDNVSVERVDTVHSREGQMDLPTFLAIAVALLVALSGYFLFNDAPVFGKRAGSRRSSRR